MVITASGLKGLDLYSFTLHISMDEWPDWVDPGWHGWIPRWCTCNLVGGHLSQY